MPLWKRLAEICVRDVRHLVVENPVVVSPDLRMEAVLAAVVRDPRTRHIYVASPDGTLLGAIRMNVLVEYLFPLVALAADSHQVAALRARTAGDLMDPEPRFVDESTALDQVAAIFLEEKINELPVVDENRRIVGQVNMHEVISQFLHATGPSGERE